jgi:DNA-binding transcriptional MocR family regulator
VTQGPALGLTQSLDRHGIIDLGLGHPDPSLLPVDGVRAAAASALERYGPEALAYGHPAGPGPLIEAIVERLGVVDARPPAASEIVVTAGTSHALDQVATLLTTPGDVVLVESPTYHLAVRILRDHPLELVPVPFDGGGLRVDAIADTLDRLRPTGRRVRLLYTVPTFHNPTGVSLDPERRRALVELAAREDLLVVEDDAYRELAYDGPPPASLWSMAEPGTVLRLGSFAKSLAPGLRVGYMTAAAPTIARFVEGGVLDSGGGISHVASLIVAEFAASGAYARQVERYRDAYRERRDALLEALAEHLPADTTWTSPQGGYFTWVTLPAGREARAILPEAEARGVSYVPGPVFQVDREGGARALRLSFSRFAPAELREAVRRLGHALR